jgi:hypothetical protein
MKGGLFVLLTFFAVNLYSQETTTVVVHKDPRLDQLVKKHIEINEVNTRDSRRFVQGFRILVISTNDRAKAMDAKTRVYKNFPELKPYLLYQSPYFKLKVGNFRDQKEADYYLKKIQLHFPTGIYIIRDMIEVNPDRSADTE